MTAPVLKPDLTGQSVYKTPEQSPSTSHIYDPFTIADGIVAGDRQTEAETEKSRNDSSLAYQKESSGAASRDNAPEVPPRPIVRDFPLGATMQKEPPQLPERPLSRQQNPPPVLPFRSGLAPPPVRPSIASPIAEEPEPGEDGRSSLKYTRDPERLIAYLIPFPKPKFWSNEQEMNVPERFLVYTPPQPHLLKPAKGTKEPKKKWVKRKLQEEVKKAKKYNGKTLSFRGLHSKTTKGVVWGIHRMKATDIVFLGRIDNNAVDEMFLVYPSNLEHTIPEIREEFIAQINRTKKRATRDAAISTFLLPVTLVIDTFAAVIWPFGGLFEIDAVWAYASIKGWNTSRIITKRLRDRESAFGKYGGKERDLYLRFLHAEKIDIMRRYLAEECHRRDPKMFPSVGVPPTEREVADAIGWAPVARSMTGSEKAEEAKGWDDEEWQRTSFKDDFKATMEKGAISWSKWCKKFEKNPEKALKK